MRKLLKFEISIAFLLLSFATVEAQRKKTVEQNIVPIGSIASLYVGAETFTIIEVTGQEIKKIISLDSSVFQIVPMKKGFLGIASATPFKNTKEFIIVAEDTIVKLNIGFSKEKKTDSFKINLKNKKEAIATTKIRPSLDSLKKKYESIKIEICDKIKNSNRNKFTVQEREHNIKLLVYDVSRDDTKLYFKVEIHNQSEIPYPISRVLVSILSRPKKGSGSSIIVPSIVCNDNINVIPPNQFRTHILAIPIVPLRDDEILELRVVEESKIAGGRNVTVEINQKTLDKLLK